MNKLIKLSVMLFLYLNIFNLKANEGMWIPMLVGRLNYADMQKAGFKLTAEEIYSINKSSLKDAVVMLNGGSCTAELISKNGLMLTNHHCAFGGIQQNSSTEHNYLKDGFWAKTKKDELKVDEMTASFLIYMKDVSKIINNKLRGVKDETQRDAVIKELSDSIKESSEKENTYNAKIKSFFGGNEFYLFVYQIYKDVRLVGAPPSSIGKFGGDTDNWMWPRHTGDFSMLRIYTSPDGKSATYSEENIPLKAKHHLPISTAGVSKDDFAMIMGYPGSTDRYLTSYGIDQELRIKQPSIIKIRTKKVNIMRDKMDNNEKINIKYASKYARVSNYWKYFIGQSKQLKKNKVYNKKITEEERFAKWLNNNEIQKQKYGEALQLIKNGTQNFEKYSKVNTYLTEAVLMGSESILFSYRFSRKISKLGNKKLSENDKKQSIEDAKKLVKKHFKDYDKNMDRDITIAMFEMFNKDIKKEFHPKLFKKLVTKNKYDFDKMVNKMFAKSIFGSKEKIMKFLENPNMKKMIKDPFFAMAMNFVDLYRKINIETKQIMTNLKKGNRLYIAGIREMDKNKKFYPNANSTMRLSYGKVKDCYAKDAVYYEYFTTFEGIIEKMDSTDTEFKVPNKLVNLYKNKNHKEYTDKRDGKLHICFLTDNDITGGNSGSPVINGKGQLIGCAFDGNWEAMSGDISFEEKVQRTIVVDIRYVLFIIDKYANADHLIDEMTIVK